MQLRDVRALERSHIGRDRVEHGAQELESLRCDLAAAPDYGARRGLYLGAGIEHGIDRYVDVVIRDLPASPNYSARRIIQPRSRSPYLHFLPPRQPEPPVDQAALEYDGNVLQILVPVRGARESDRHTHHRPAPPVDVHGSDCTCRVLILRTETQLHHVQRPVAKPYLQRVANGEIV